MKITASPEKQQHISTPFRSRGKDAVQPKLFINEPGDRHEVEADRAAEQVVNSRNMHAETQPTAPTTSVPVPRMENTVQQKPISAVLTPYIQRKEETQPDESDISGTEDKVGLTDHVGPIQRMEDEDSVQMKEDEESAQLKEDESEPSEGSAEPPGEGDDSVALKEEDRIQTKRSLQNSSGDTGDVSTMLKNSRGQGSPLPSEVRGKMESGFSADFSNVRIHTGPNAVGMNRQLGAKAFTSKGDIYFNEGKFNPTSREGKFLLAHELTHTLQQGATTPQTADKNLVNERKETRTADNASPQLASSSGEMQVAKPLPQVKGNLLPAEGGAAGEEATAEQGANEKEIADPFADPEFSELIGEVEETADSQEQHAPAGELSEDAQDAAESPSNERESIAQAEQVDEMEQAEPQPFSAEAFKAKLMERIDSMQLPENQEEADDFENNNNIDEINKEAVGDVGEQTDKAAGPVVTTTDQKPNTAAVKPRKAETLKAPKAGPKPKGVDASKAVPKKRSDSEVNAPLKEQTDSIDQRMAESEVTDRQLEKSEEPKFQQALGSKKEANENAKSAPQTFRQQEEGTLQSTSEKTKNASREQLQGMHQVRTGAFSKVLGNQKATGKKDTSERERIASDINVIYETTKRDVNSILDTLEETVSKRFEYFSKVAKRKFEDYVALSMALYKAERYGGIGGGLRWTKDLFMGLPDEVNEYFVQGKEKFVEAMEEGITNIATLVARELNRAKARIEKGKKEVGAYVESLPKNLKHLGREAASEINEKFDELTDEVNSREEALIDTLAQEYVSAMEEVDERIEEMKEANKGLVDAALGFINGVIETILKLKEMIVNLFSAIKSVIGVIMADPIGFMGDLFEGIGKGIDAFKANIQNHLLGGLLEWLTGSLGPMGIVMPKDIFSLSGIFNLVLQVLGLGWDYIRLKAVKLMGEPVVKALESGYDMFKTFATKGIDGIWEFLKDKFSDLKETVIDAIKDMLIVQVIQAGIKWLLSLLIPGAGFIKAIMAIKDLIVFFVESAIMLIPAITEAILALAAGSVAGVAKAIEMGLARLIALVIGLFAKLIGLGGLSKKVTAIFKKIRKRVNRAVMKLLTKAKKKGRQLMRKLGIGKKNQKGKDNSSNEKLNLTSITRSVPTKTDGTHVLLVKKKGNDYQLKIRSKETFYESFITSLEDTNSNQSLKTRALTLARDLDNQFGLADSDKDKVKIEKDLKELSELTIKIVDLSGVKPLQPENIYKGGGKHGIKMQKNDGIMWAKKPTELSPPRAPLPIGKWGNKEDLEYAGKIAATFKDNDIHDVPINAGNNSIVYYHDGTESKPDRIRIRKNKNNKFFHGFPIDSRTAGKIF